MIRSKLGMMAGALEYGSGMWAIKTKAVHGLTLEPADINQAGAR